MKYGNYLAFAFFICITEIEADIYDYIYPKSSASFSNYGALGVIQNPNARFYEAGTIAFNWTKNEPYSRGSILAYPFDWLEAAYYYVDINNGLYSLSPDFSGNQTYKDKGFEFKIRLFKEKEYFPSIAVGARDAAGTGVFAGEYIVASKKFNNLDFTLGMGWGTLAGGSRISNPLIKLGDRFRSRTDVSNTAGGDFNINTLFSGGQASIFWGAEYILPNFNGVRLKLEYDSTDYTLEGFPLGRQSSQFGTYPVKKPDSRFNFALVYPASNRFHFSIGVTKGNTLNIGFSMNGPFGSKDPFIKKIDKYKPVKNSEVIKELNAKNGDIFVYRTSLLSLQDNNLSLQKAEIDENKISIVYSQSKFSSYMHANGRAMRVLDEILPDEFTEIELINVNAGQGMFSTTMYRNLFEKYSNVNNISVLKEYTKIEPVDLKKRNFSYNPSVNYPAHFWKISPDLRSQLGGPDGFYFGDLRIAFNSELQFSKNISLNTSMSAGITNNYEELKLASDSILPHVRTDIVKYLKNTEDFAINRLQLNYVNSLRNNIYYKFSGGFLESMFAGIGTEVLYRPFFSSIAIGAELWRVKQREYDMLLGFLEDKSNKYLTTTGHLNFYYMNQPSKILFTLRGGKFLARDSGLNFDFSRVFDNGLRIGAFFSLTDISKTEFGEGSFDKGFYFHIPLESFFTNYQKGVSGFGLRPLTRDGAAFIIHGHSLYGITDQAQYYNINRGWYRVYD